MQELGIIWKFFKFHFGKTSKFLSQIFPKLAPGAYGRRGLEFDEHRVADGEERRYTDPSGVLRGYGAHAELSVHGFPRQPVVVHRFLQCRGLPHVVRGQSQRAGHKSQAH